MKLFKKKSILFPLALFIPILLHSNDLLSQENSNNTIYSYFDQVSGKENLSVYNGTLHVNTYKTKEKSNNMYYVSDEFTKGDVTYDGQFYYDVELKYDILKDQLIIKPQNESYRAVNLIKEKIAQFSIYKKTFVNLSLQKDRPGFVDGFYEQNLVTDYFTFYIKHHKDIRTITANDIIHSDFKKRDSYLLAYKNTFISIGSSKDLQNVFPEYKSKIRNYYSDNSKMNKSDQTAFMESLMKYINNLSK